MINKSKKQFIVLEVIVAVIFLIYLYPFLIIIINSAKDAFTVTQQPLAWPEQWSKLGTNIGKIWSDANIQYPSSFRSSIIITVFSLAALNIFSSQAAWVLVRTKTKLSNVFFLIFVAAMVIPFQIVMFPLLTWFRNIHSVLGIRLLRTYGGMIFAYLGFGMSLSIFMFHGFIKAVPHSLEEAAIIDGCTKPQIFYQIVTPLLTPIHATVMILNGIWIWNDYLLPLMILGKGNRIQTFPLAVSNFAGAYVSQWDLIMTAILMAIIPIVIVFLILQKYIVKGMTAGSIK